MFSGIVQKTAKAKKIDKIGDSLRVTFDNIAGFYLKAGESVLVDGVCSTVEKKTIHGFRVFWMGETLRKTVFGRIDVNHKYNFEKCLRLDDLVGGHLVSGHVDTTAEVKSVKNDGESRNLKFKTDPKFTKYIIYKGSICVNGVSLTVTSVSPNSFSVSLIPYTLTHTNLGNLKVGDLVNIEVDMIAKYLEKLRI